MEKWLPQCDRFCEISFGTIKAFAVGDPRIVQKVLLSTNPLHVNKPQYMYGKFCVEWVRDGILNSDYILWHGARKMVGRSLTYKSLLTCLKYMNNHSRNLVKSLWEQSSKEDVSGDLVWNSISFRAVKIIGR